MHITGGGQNFKDLPLALTWEKEEVKEPTKN